MSVDNLSGLKAIYFAPSVRGGAAQQKVVLTQDVGESEPVFVRRINEAASLVAAMTASEDDTAWAAMALRLEDISQSTYDDGVA